MRQVKGNQEMIKKLNRSLVLDVIRNEKSISRSEIARRLNISSSTVSAIIDELIKKKLVEEIGFGSSTKSGGRRSVQLGFNPKSGFCVGIDIGGTKILIVLTDLAGDIVYKKKYPTNQDVDQIVRLIRESIVESKISEEKIVCMGIGVPSITDIEEGIVIDAPALGWVNLPLQKMIQDQFNFPVYINNDVNCAALGEKYIGSGGKSDDIFFIAIGTGVGSAIISGGNLVYGFNFQAGEIAYSISKEDIRNHDTNRQGEFGVFEKKVSGQSLSKRGFTTEELFNQYEIGNEDAISIIEEFILELSVVIINAINLLNSEKVIIGGGISESMGGLVDKIQENVNRLTPIKTTVQLASLGGDAGGLGAIAYAFEKIQESNEF